MRPRPSGRLQGPRLYPSRTPVRSPTVDGDVAQPVGILVQLARHVADGIPVEEPQELHHRGVDRLEVGVLHPIDAADLARDELASPCAGRRGWRRDGVPPRAPAGRQSTPPRCSSRVPAARRSPRARCRRRRGGSRRHPPVRGCRARRHRCRSGASLEPGAADLVRHLEDRAGDLDVPRAGLHAVEGRAASPHAVGVGHDLEPLLGA